jgi:YD repeat-containing protein
MSSERPQRSGLCRFQIRRDRDGTHRWYVYNSSGTLVGRHPEGFASEREARLDAEQLQEQIAKAPILGEDDVGRGPPR